MPEAAVTIDTAVDNPSRSGPLVSAVPAAPPAAPRDGVISDAAYNALPLAERDRFARVRQGPQGGSMWQDRSTLSSETADTTKPAVANGAPTVTADGRLQVGEFLLSPQDIQTLMAEKAQSDLRRTQIPTSAENYEAKPPETFRLPENRAFEFDVNSPQYLDARKWAHANGLSQNQFSEMLSFYASKELAEQAWVANAARAEVEKLGPNGLSRVSAVETFLRGHLGDGHGRALRTMLVSAATVVAMEKLVALVASQGAASFRQHGREPPGQPGKVDDATWEGMSHGQRLDYARQFDQRQFSGR
jgi:hypothetical protein